MGILWVQRPTVQYPNYFSEKFERSKPPRKEKNEEVKERLSTKINQLDNTSLEIWRLAEDDRREGQKCYESIDLQTGPRR